MILERLITLALVAGYLLVMAPTNTLDVISTQPNQLLQRGAGTFVKGSRAVVFARAFGSVPTCVCSDIGGAAAECASDAPSMTGVTFYGKRGAAAFSWICVGTL